MKSVIKNKTIIVADRYHVAKLYRSGLDKYRQKILKQLKHELPHHEYEKLKGSMHILRRTNECLTKNEKTILDNLFSHAPELAQAYSTAVYTQPTRVQSATNKSTFNRNTTS